MATWTKTETGYTDGRFSINRSSGIRASGSFYWVMLDGTMYLGTRGKLRNAKAVCENIRGVEKTWKGGA